jgi:cytochrome b561
MASGPLQDRLYNLHRSTGALVLVLAIIRLCIAGRIRRFRCRAHAASQRGCRERAWDCTRC